MADKRYQEQPCVIFDFDGTLVDIPSDAIHVYNDLAQTLGTRPADLKTVRSLSDDLPTLLKHFRIPFYYLPLFFYRIRTYYAKNFLHLNLHEGLREQLDLLKKKGYRLGIVSTSPRHRIEGYLSYHQLTHFDFIMTSWIALGKTHALQKAIAKYQLKPQTTVYIGDEVRDMNAAKACRLMAIGVTWSVYTQKTLQAAGSDATVETPSELYPTIQKFLKAPVLLRATKKQSRAKPKDSKS